MGTTRWGPSLAVSAVVLALLAASAALFAANRPTRAYGTGPGSFVLSGTDYAFDPSRLSWRVGERVTITFVNDSDGRPGKQHELMLGRRPSRVLTAFGSRLAGGFDVDFFEGVRVDVLEADGLSMLMPGKARVRGMGSMGGMQMGGMEHANQDLFMAQLDPGGRVTLSFVVPDRPGRWEIGCFAQTAQHYANGMRSEVTVARS